MAVDLNGQPPMQVFVRLCPRPEIVLRSIDLGVEERIGSYAELDTFAQPGSAFALAKAACALAGFLPRLGTRGRPRVAGRAPGRIWRRPGAVAALGRPQGIRPGHQQHPGGDGARRPQRGLRAELGSGDALPTHARIGADDHHRGRVAGPGGRPVPGTQARRDRARPGPGAARALVAGAALRPRLRQPPHPALLHRPDPAGAGHPRRNRARHLPQLARTPGGPGTDRGQPPLHRARPRTVRLRRPHRRDPEHLAPQTETRPRHVSARGEGHPRSGRPRPRRGEAAGRRRRRVPPAPRSGRKRRVPDPPPPDGAPAESPGPVRRFRGLRKPASR